MVGEGGESDNFPPDGEKLAYHDFQYHQTFNVAGVELGSSWAEFIANSQGYQAKLLKYSLELYRQAKYEKLGGMFQFMFMDCWNAITWSVVSYNRTPKQGYHVLKQCYQPVLIGSNLWGTTLLIGESRGGLTLPFSLNPWVVNDRHEALHGCTYTAVLSGMGRTLTLQPEGTFDLPADSVTKRTLAVSTFVPADLPPGQYVLTLTLKQGSATLSENTYALEAVIAP
jgi:beta-mannosidase